MHLDSDSGFATCSGVHCTAEEDLTRVGLLMLSETASVSRISYLVWISAC